MLKKLIILLILLLQEKRQFIAAIKKDTFREGRKGRKTLAANYNIPPKNIKKFLIKHS